MSKPNTFGSTPPTPHDPTVVPVILEEEQPPVLAEAVNVELSPESLELGLSMSIEPEPKPLQPIEHLSPSSVLNDTNAIEHLVSTVHDWAVRTGWWADLETGESLTADYPAGEKPTGAKSIGNIVALLHSEVSEAFEGDRKNLQDEHIPEFTSFEVELADLLIRLLDTAGGLNLRLVDAFLHKMAYNAQRADHKIDNRKAEGGKTV